MGKIITKTYTKEYYVGQKGNEHDIQEMDARHLLNALLKAQDVRHQHDEYMKTRDTLKMEVYRRITEQG